MKIRCLLECTLPFDERLRHLPLSRSGDRAPRFEVAVAIRADQGTGQEWVTGQTVNISRSGLRIIVQLRSGIAWSIGDVLDLEIAPDGYFLRESLSIKAKIVRMAMPEETLQGPVTPVALSFLRD